MQPQERRVSLIAAHTSLSGLWYRFKEGTQRVYGDDGLLFGSLYGQIGVIVYGAPLLRQKAVQWLVNMLIYLFVANFAWSWVVVGLWMIKDVWSLEKIIYPQIAQVYTSGTIPNKAVRQNLRGGRVYQLDDQLCYSVHHNICVGLHFPLKLRSERQER